MAIEKTTVFIASRFEEFAEVRQHLRRLINEYPKLNMAAIDLNDGSVSARPPLNVCLGNVQQSDFMILLLGETYGGLAPGKEKSFTHLEYEEAIREDSETYVLAFGIGPSYAAGRITASSHPQMAAWQQAVEANHTMGFFGGELAPEAVAKAILDHLLMALYDRHFGQLDFADEDHDEALGESLDGAALSNDEVESLEALRRRISGESAATSERPSLETALTQPALMAASEQIREAEQALSVGLAGLAAHHYRRALEWRPMDFAANYWLSRLYLSTGQRRFLPDIRQMLERAARLATAKGESYRASDCYQLLARAALSNGEAEEARDFARKACEAEPRFGRAFYEQARILIQLGHQREAMLSLERAIHLYLRIGYEAKRDPAFRPVKKRIVELMQGIREHLSKRVGNILSVEANLERLLGLSGGLAGRAEVATRAQANAEIEASLRRQRFLIAQALERVKAAEFEATAQNPALLFPKKTPYGFRPDHASFFVVSRWLKREGDKLEAGEPVCELALGQRGSPFTLRWKGETVALAEHLVPAGSTVQAWEGDSLFSTIPIECLGMRQSKHSRLLVERENLDTVYRSQKERERSEQVAREERFKQYGAASAVLAIFGIFCLGFLGWHGFGALLLLAAIPTTVMAYQGRVPVDAVRRPSRIDEIDEEITQLKKAVEEAQRNLCAMHAEWEKTLSALKESRFFQQVESANVGQQVVSTLQELRTEKVPGITDVLLNNPLVLANGETRLRLFRVVERRNEKLVLDEARAYEDMQFA